MEQAMTIAEIEETNFQALFQQAKEILKPEVLNQEQYDEALSVLNQAIQIKPDAPKTLSIMGHCYRMTNQLELSINCYQKCLQAQPDSGVGSFGLYLALVDAGRDPEAIDELKRFLSIAHSTYHQDALNNLLNLLPASMREQFATEDLIRKLRAGDDKDFERMESVVLEIIARRHEKAGQFQAVINCCKRIIELSPLSERASLTLFRTLWETEQFVEAVSELKRHLIVARADVYDKIMLDWIELLVPANTEKAKSILHEFKNKAWAGDTGNLDEFFQQVILMAYQAYSSQNQAES